ncbi:acyl carrier protein [Arcobacter nitrofigilis DSM 7299]|uniref:Acyl carrier protein n=1 Tax=Arcobacter nitrofigilis (strain ATCC 33309 / DSM 7299 / CCUG 15893 / LMG 7604 / NCTC 12251 / CI) TaxID=572480 RepID=D5V104_ARCNC|nr:phosphopantetheine-binding protein [Arcobacter nitrofigilis]ADG93966.1 acyl carrier protein [Arcobacter nitrofigilis DSM 7299]
MSDLKYELKKLIIEECEKECEVEDIKDDDILFDPESPLELDSMDALQISMALHKKYGMKTTDSKELRKIMVSINTLAKYIEENE